MSKAKTTKPAAKANKAAHKSKPIKKAAPAKKTKAVTAPVLPKKASAKAAAPVLAKQASTKSDQPVLSRKSSVKAPVLPKQASKGKKSQTLYILLLDKSGSMMGKNWTDLTAAVGSFLQILEGDPAQQESSKVTIILYDHNAYLTSD